METLGIGHRLMRGERLVLIVDDDRLAFGIEHHVTEVAASGLLGANALAQFARARFKNLDRNAVFRLEGFCDRFVGRNANERRVERETALLLGVGDDLVPARNLRLRGKSVQR